MALAVTDDDAFFSHLGAWVLSGHETIGPDDMRRRIQVGRTWWNKKLHEIETLVCNSEVVAQVAEGPEAQLAAAIADAILAAHTDWPVSSIARYIAKRGLDVFCSRYER